MNIVIPSAGAGSRFKHVYDEPKPYIKVNNLPMVVLAVQTLGIQGTYHYILPKHNHNPVIQKYLNYYTPECTFFELDYVTEGAVQSVLLIEDQINNDDELIIANCDQVMSWNVVDVLADLRKFDAGLVTIHSDEPKHSYAKVENGLVTNVVEKQVISDIALTGIHYWKRGSDFVASAKQLIADDNRSLNEFYISTTYNYLIEKGLKVGHHMLDDSGISFIGTPEDLDIYLGRRSLGY